MTSTIDALNSFGTGLPSPARTREMKVIFQALGDRIWHQDYSGDDPYITARVYRAEAMFGRIHDVAR